MRKFTPEQLYVAVNSESLAENSRTVNVLARTGARIALGVNATEMNGLPSTLKKLEMRRFAGTLADRNYDTITSNTSSSLEMLQRLHSIEYVTVSGSKSRVSLSRAATFGSNSLQIVSRGIDSDMPEEEFLVENGISIKEATIRRVEKAKSVGIEAFMGAGVDVDVMPEMCTFLTGIRVEGSVEGLGENFEDDQVRVIDPVKALEIDPEANLVIGRYFTAARDPASAVGNFVDYVNQG